MTPVYKDYTGDTKPRNWKSAQSEPEMVYLNNTGRNDFHIMKISRDNDNVDLDAEIVANITPNSGDNWMRLYIM